MKTLLLTLTVLLTLHITKAQQAQVSFKDGQVINLRINAHSDSQVYTTEGNYNHTDIKAVTFKEQNSKMQNLIKALTNNNVSIIFDQSLGPYISKRPQDSPTYQEDELTRIKESLTRFRKAHGTGLGLQILGIVGAGVAIAADSPELAVGSGVLSIIGTVVEAGSGKQLIFTGY